MDPMWVGVAKDQLAQAAHLYVAIVSRLLLQESREVARNPLAGVATVRQRSSTCRL